MGVELDRVLDTLPGMVFSAHPDGRVDFVNKNLAAFSGSLEDWHGHDCWPIAASQDETAKIARTWRAKLGSGQSFEMEMPLRARDGTQRCLTLRCNLYEEHGQIKKWYGTAVEMPPRQRDNAPKDNYFQRVINSIPVPVAVTTPNGEVESLNEPALAYFGMSLGELQNWKATEVVHPDDLRRTIDDQLEAHRTGTFYNVESRHLRWVGVYRWHTVLGLPLKNSDGSILCWFHLLVDIEDRKLAETELVAREREARLILDSIPAGIDMLGPSGEVLGIDSQLLQYYGRSLDELRGWAATDVVHPEDMPRMTAAVESSIGSGAAYDVEVRLRRADGTHRWFQVVGHPLRDTDGKEIRWYALHIDIDQRKRAEQALQESETNLRNIINALPTTAWTTRPDGYCDFLNDRWLNYAGYTAEQAEGWGWAQVIHPDDLGGLTRYWQSHLASGTPVDIESRMLGRDGTYRWFLFRATPFCDSAGNIIKWYGANIDIEDRKRAEKALAERERESRFIIDGIDGMIAIFSPDGALLGGNQQILDYFQLPLDDLNNWATNGITHPDDLKVCIDAFTSSLVTGEPYDYETRFRRFDGVFRWFQLRGLPLRDSAGNIVRWYGLLTDIDDCKHAEERQRPSKAFLADAQRLSKTGSFSMNLATDEIVWSAETYRIFDVDAPTPITLDTILHRLDPDSVTMVEKVVRRSRACSGLRLRDQTTDGGWLRKKR
jgi:PAS domain S-box-containing protein